MCALDTAVGECCMGRLAYKLVQELLEDAYVQTGPPEQGVELS